MGNLFCEGCGKEIDEYETVLDSDNKPIRIGIGCCAEEYGEK